MGTTLGTVSVIDWAGFGVQIATMVFLAGALLFTGWQFITRHRPHLGVAAIEVVPGHEGGRATYVTLENWGQIEADRISITLRYALGDDETDTSQLKTTIFAGQRAGIAFSPPDRVQEIFAQGEAVRLRITITYWSPTPRVLSHWRGFRHSFQSGYWVSPTQKELWLQHG